MTIWDKIIGSALGAVIEVVKSVVTMLFNKILNTVVQPMLNGQITSLNDLFDGETPDMIAVNEQSTNASMGSTLDIQNSLLSTVGSSIQSLMSAGIVFSGTGTIIEPLISMTGPGIMSTLIDLIGSTILNISSFF